MSGERGGAGAPGSEETASLESEVVRDSCGESVEGSPARGARGAHGAPAPESRVTGIPAPPPASAPLAPSARPAPARTPRTRTRKPLFIILSIIAVLMFTAGGIIGYRIVDSHMEYSDEDTGEILFRIDKGDTGTEIATALETAGIIKHKKAFIDLLLEDSSISLEPGLYAMRTRMSAQAALNRLLDPSSRQSSRIVLPEGITSHRALEIIAKQSGMDLSEVEEAAADPASLGVPSNFPSIEGYLFPATYVFDVDATAHDILKQMVSRMDEALDDARVPDSKTLEVLTLASIVQREGGEDLSDYPKIARVFLNRIQQGKNLESDATVVYGTGNYSTVWTTRAERESAANLYNTYAHPGLPPGPISLPGDAAIEAVMHPAEGDWLYFVPVNLETGETRFAKTEEEHEQNVKILQEWCAKNEEAGGKYCQ